MKYISFAVPCYNSEAYMERAVESILKGGEDVEILIVNDGSQDGTLDIAKRYEKEYPTIVKVVDKENGGHGDAVNAGLAQATGLYFKVLDSDDWVDHHSLQKILETIHRLVREEHMVDMILSNYVYEKEGEKRKKVIHYQSAMPEEKILTWKDIRRFKIGQYILMHSVMYRTELLKMCNLKLPKHTFYVDNIYVYYPLPHVKTLYYINVNFYRYYIGREDQSVNEAVMIKRIDQQIFVTKTMIDMYELHKLGNAKLRNYMINYLAIMMTVSSILAIRSKSEENLEKKKQLWAYLKNKDPKVYHQIRYGILGQTMNLPGKPGREVSSFAYMVAKRIYKFN